ncbi:transposase [Candidatus Parcubacteria bacterium]|nr:transposase [Candidatus Parcubacteria bacterium]
MRKFVFQNDQYYHIYNRGVDKREIFNDNNDYLRFLFSMRELNNNLLHSERTYIRNQLVRELNSETSELSSLTKVKYFIELENKPRLVSLICYCLNPNHLHLIVKQSERNGISRFMQKLSKSYTNYFNIKHNRSGALFQGTFKAVQIKTDERLLWLSGYVNGNPEIHGVGEARRWPWSSCQDYIGLRSGNLCKKEVILSQFGDSSDYNEYVKMVISGAREKKGDMKKYLFE